jgi:very-short-patch-repair endonuclease
MPKSNFENFKGTQSPIERLFLEDCIVVGLQVESQHKIGEIHADFAVVDKKLAIEIDSKQYHSSDESEIEDEKRNKIYQENGWGVIRILGRVVIQGTEEIAWKIKKGNYDGCPLSYVINGGQIN